jgi:hypothetical protein
MFRNLHHYFNSKFSLVFQKLSWLYSISIATIATTAVVVAAIIVY